MPLIVYLRADRLIPTHPGLSDATRVPCSEHKVQTKMLATLLFASAFWSLRDQGLVGLEASESHPHRPREHGAEVRVARLHDGSAQGLEGVLLANVEGEESLHEVVCRWSGLRSTDPWHDAVREAVAEALAGGYLHEVKAGGVSRLLWGTHEVTPDCGRVAGLETHFLDFETSWRRFESAERDFHDVLLDDCKKSLLECTEAWYA